MQKIRRFYSRKANRSPGHDYSENGYYYVTICAKDRREIFGRIENDRMILNRQGEIVENTWQQIPKHFTGIDLDQYIIMPNHVHGIIILDNPVGTRHALSSNKASALSSNKTNNLSIIIGSFKSAVSKYINRLNNDPFRWQRSFYDHRIRTDKSLQAIREYIANNSATWDTDENNIHGHSIEDKACLVPTGQLYV